MSKNKPAPSRTSLWKEYRQNINDNNFLNDALFRSNKTLATLYARLLKVAPQYRIKRAIQPLKTALNLQIIKQPQPYDVALIKELLTMIAQLENKPINNALWSNELSFSSGQLDQLIANINVGKQQHNQYISMLDDNIMSIKVKKVILEGAKNEPKN